MTNKCILFTDIKGSSLLWQKHKEDMYLALKKHNNQINQLAKKHRGFIVKMIGDAFMVSFDTLQSGVSFAYELSAEQKNAPIRVGSNDTIMLRIGICYGPVEMKKMKIQNKNLIDYFGATVNIASRMESKVAEPMGFAVAIHGEKKINNEILDMLRAFHGLKVKNVYFTYKKCAVIKRSKRLFNSAQNGIECYSADQLKGVGEILAYRCDLSIN